MIELILFFFLNLIYILGMYMIWYVMNDQLVDERKKNRGSLILYDILPLTLKSKRKQIEKLLLNNKIKYIWTD